MDKKLPAVFVNRQNKKIDNNKEVYYSFEKNKINNLKKYNPILVRKKINDLFESSRFIYKMDVVITTSEGDFRESIIAKNNNYLITLSNRQYLIDNIIDIREF